jgi:outer membrane assembly lipoprotein YfgL
VKINFDLSRLGGRVLALAVLSLLAACSSGPEKPKPAELGANPALLGVRTAWTAKMGAVNFPLQVKAHANTVTLADSEGMVAAFDARTGAQRWRTSVGAAVVAGVGSDGRYSALVTRSNELVTLDGGLVIWQEKLTAPSYTAPLVAGGRVFVLAADRSVSAFDATSGRKIWNQQRPGEALVLRQDGVLLAVGDTLVAGMGGRLVGLNPGNGAVRWETAIATPRGTNDLERLVDLVGSVSRDGSVVCTRAFQSAVGCVDAARGTLLWSKPAQGLVGVQGDAKHVFGVESDGKVIAWRRSDGERAWVAEQLRYRNMTAPLVVGRALVMGDDTGWVHWLSQEGGASLARATTDGSALMSAPVLVDGTVVVVTRTGNIFGFRPE